MQVSLDTLGHRQQMMLLQLRAASITGQNTGPRSEGGVIALPASGGSAAPGRLGWLGRLWARGADSPPQVASQGLASLRGLNYGIMGGMIGGSLGLWMPAVFVAATGEHLVGVLMGVLGATMSGFGLWMPGHWLRRLCRPPVSAEEVEALHAATQDELERAYLRLVADAVRQEVVPETAPRVRAALQAVGEAVAHLPAVTVPRASVDTLRAEAARAQAEARAEGDAVIAASHERKADALHRSALAAQRSQMLMRRAAALREEMMAQIESLRLGLTGLDAASGEVSGLASLADAVRDVASEAAAAADARAELDASLSGTPAPPVTPPGEMARQLRAGVRFDGTD